MLQQLLLLLIQPFKSLLRIISFLFDSIDLVLKLILSLLLSPLATLDDVSKRSFFFSTWMFIQFVKIASAVHNGMVQGSQSQVSLLALAAWLSVDVVFLFAAYMVNIKRPGGKVLFFNRRTVFLTILISCGISASVFGAVNYGIPWMNARSSSANLNAQRFGYMDARPILAKKRGQEIIVGSGGDGSADGSGGGDSGMGGGTSDKVILDKVASAFNDTHLRGSHIVHVLPYSLAKLNMNASSSFSLSSTNPFILLPILIKGTPPWMIDYEHISLDGKVNRHVNVSVDMDMTETLGGSSSSASDEYHQRKTVNFYLKVDQPGWYKLVGIREKDGIEGKVIKSQAIVPVVVNAPEAAFEPSGVIAEMPEPATRPRNAYEAFEDAVGGEINRCMDDSVTVNLRAFGVPPLSVWYLKQFSGANAVVQVDLNGEVDTEEGVGEGSLSEQGKKLKRQEITIPIEIKGDQPGVYLFRILRVMDGLNNTVEYQSSSEAALPPIQSTSPEKVASSHRVGDQLLFVAHGHPTIRLGTTCTDKTAIRTDANEAFNLPVALEGYGPFNLVYSFSPLSDPTKVNEKVMKDVTQKQFNIRIREPGSYRLLSIQDHYCAGEVLTPFSCTVFAKQPPTLGITTNAREETCVGTTGVEVEFKFTGEPPFWVEYQETLAGHGSVVKRVSNIWKQRHFVELKPNVPGEYSYSFTRFGDGSYNDGLKLNHTTSFKQFIHPRSSARFISSSREFKKCLGDSVSFQIALEGSGPWNVKYDLIHGNERQNFELKDMPDSRVTIYSPQFDKAGVWTFSLISVTDNIGCTFDVDVPDIKVEIFSQRPTASFRCPPKPIMFLEGEGAQLPVVFTGNMGPYSLEYGLEDGGDKKRVGEIRGNTHDIWISQPGTYKLFGVSDAICPGSVVEPVSCSASIVTKPSVKAPPKQRPGLCRGTPDFVELELSGKPTFSIAYTIQHQDAQSRRSTNKLSNQVGQTIARIPLTTDAPGKYTYTVTGISDGNYKRPIAVRNPDGSSIEWTQEIYAIPNARFVKSPHRHSDRVSYESSHCLGDHPTPKLTIEFDGHAPFDLTISIKHENGLPEKLHFTNIPTNRYEFQPPALDQVGLYTLQILSVSDMNGCGQTFDSAIEDMDLLASITVSDVARIQSSSSSPETVCLGSVLSFSLTGVPSFLVSYQLVEDMEGKGWVGDVMELEVREQQLKLLAAEPGVLKILKVCNKNGCCTKPKNLTHIIHDLPKALMDGGSDIIEDIREGDETEINIDLTGSPPFSFTYTRQSLRFGTEGGVTEPEPTTVTNFMGQRFVIKTSQEGLFQVTAIYDRFCGFPQTKPSLEGVQGVVQRVGK